MSFHLVLILKEFSRADLGDARVKLPSPLAPCSPLSLSGLSDFPEWLPSAVSPAVGIALGGVNSHHISAPRPLHDAAPSHSCPWKAKGCLELSCLPSQASNCTKGDAIKSWGRGNLQVIFGFHSFSNHGGREGVSVGSLLKSGTFEVNGVAIFWGGTFPGFF